jgi:FkbM family methyltransferase
MIKKLKPLARRMIGHVPPLEKLAWRSRAYSQEGEDLILARFFGYQAKGFYVDVGAHHPLRFSNTQIFYDRGWSGINIDAMPGSMASFRTHRPRDVNIEAGVGQERGALKFYVFNEPALNTFDAKVAEQHRGGPYELKEEVDVQVLPLRDMLAEHVPAGREIDFLTVDVEGRDLQVLQSNEWGRFRPRVILAESLNSRLQGIDSDPVASFLQTVGYEPFAKTVNTLFFVRRDD